MMAYTDLLNPDAGLMAFTFAIVQTATLIVVIAISIEGYLLRPLKPIERVLAIAVVPWVLFNPLSTGFVGVLVILGLIGVQWKTRAVVAA
ncbi:hypothetical protein [Shewanella sp. 10N.286.48.A6]|uniref:hypothetical protein n=1 Tax=Shewanella sp. 10N.286.48.A6 TaxID=1880833 RepID=UPI000C8683CF|nr:hypothetical protein [Shewanella sp. 10N.286.48.A6]PMI02536.1 hypothetical protein BCU55_06570 [Shewanella sp. 10N.286.48.A6]